MATACPLSHARHPHPPLSEAARRALPLVMLPLLAAGDLTAIYNELRAIHLRTLNKVGGCRGSVAVGCNEWAAADRHC